MAPYYALQEIMPIIPKTNTKEPKVIKHTIEVSTYNPKTEVTTKNITKYPCPILENEATSEGIISFLSEFARCAAKMGWTTGDQLFTNFEDHLRGSFMQTWTVAKGNRSKTADNWEESISDFKLAYLPADAYHIQKRYLLNAKKALHMEPKEVANRLGYLNTLLPLLPGAPDTGNQLSDQDLASAFHDSMPMDWKRSFSRANQQVHNTTLTEIAEYMQARSMEDPPNERKGGNDSRRNNDRNRDRRNGNGTRRDNKGGDRNRGRYNDRNNDHGNDNKKNGRNNDSSSNDRPGRIQKSDPCPLPGHKGHTWGDCRQNAYGNTKRDESNRDSNTIDRSNNSGNNNKRREQSPDDAHFCQEIEPLQTDHETMDLFHVDAEPESPTHLETVHPQPLVKPNNLVPQVLGCSSDVAQVKGPQVFVMLLDSGAFNGMIQRSCLPKGAVVEHTGDDKPFVTAQGTFTSNETVTIRKLAMPEFSHHRTFDKLVLNVFDSPLCRYNIIMGRDFLSHAKIKLDFDLQETTWLDSHVPFHPSDHFKAETNRRAALRMEPLRVQDALSDGYATTILKADYHKVDTDAVAHEQTHLNQEQRDQLQNLLARFPRLFSGKLGCYTKKKFHLELKRDAIPYHAKAYAVPRTQETVFMNEMDRLEDEGVLVPCGASKWASPAFIIPKKNGQVRWVADFRELNKRLERNVYPLPKISDIIRRQEPFKFITIIDISMQYFTFELDNESSWLCVLVTPFGKRRQTRVAMGVKQASDWAQEVMEEIFQDMIREVELYMDDIKRTDLNFDEHMKVIATILHRLDENGFTVNPAKCTWAAPEAVFLGHLFTQDGVKPWSKKVEAMLAIKPPVNTTQVRAFNSLIGYYRDFYPHRAHLLAPLAALTSRTKDFNWTPECQRSFDEMKAVLAKETMLSYADLSKTFHVYADASDYQLGGIIKQHDKPIAYFSRKLTSAQQNYTTIEKELLSVVETLQEFRTLLYGTDIIVHTDHKNLTGQNINTPRVLRWRLLIEDFAPAFEYIPGPKNIEADALSRLPRETASDMQHDAIQDALVHHPHDLNEYPLDLQRISTRQAQDLRLEADKQANPGLHRNSQFAHNLLLAEKLVKEQWKIWIPSDLLQPIAIWYHSASGHAGSTRVLASIRSHFHHPDLDRVVKAVTSSCRICPLVKKAGKKYGHLPARQEHGMLWDEVAVDLLGPFHIRYRNVSKSFLVLTIIELRSNLAELVRVDNKTAFQAATRFEQTYLARYPRPLRCIHDNGTEFTGIAFQMMLINNGIRNVTTTVYNPQANSINERLNQTIGNMIRANTSGQQNPHFANIDAYIDSLLSDVIHGVRSTVHSTFRISPGSLVFNRDMILPIPIHADFAALRNRRQDLIDRNAIRENNKRIHHDYRVNDEVYVINNQLRFGSKLTNTTRGPYTVAQVFTNGTVNLRLANNMLERINIRRLRPYRPLPPPPVAAPLMGAE